MVQVQHVEVYTPSEAAEMGSPNVILQREHRRRFPEWYPKGSGHSRFDLFQILQMRFVNDAAQFHIGPLTTYATGEWVAHHALQFALAMPGCMVGDLTSMVTLPDATEDETRRIAARLVFVNSFGRPRITATEFAFIWGDGTDWFGPSMEACMGSLPADDPRHGKPVMAVHLPSFAQQVVSKLPRPAVRVMNSEG